MKRTAKNFCESDSKTLLDAIGVCRTAAIHASALTPINGDVHNRCQELIRSINSLTTALTGAPTHFYARLHTAGG